MVAEARLKSKNLYKVELYLLKIMPMVIALAYLVNTVSSYFGVDIPILASIIRNKALGRKMPKDTRCKISLNHSKSNLLKINDEVGSIRYWALKIGKAHSVLSYRLKVHGIDNLRKYIEQRIKLV